MTTYQSVYQISQRRRQQQIFVPMPTSSPQCLVFAYDLRAGKFNTSSYTPLLTQGRIGEHELHLFFEEVNAPLKKWHEKYKYLFYPSWKHSLVFIVLAFLVPLGILMACWLSCKQSQSNKEHENAVEEARTIIRDLNPSFTERGVIWLCPDRFPKWIELKTNHQESQPRRENRVHQGIPVSPQPRPTPVIHIISMPQQNYQNIQTPDQQGYYSPMQQNSEKIDVSGENCENA